MNEYPPPPKQRTLSPAFAFFGSFFGPGVGFVYVGELGWALATVFGLYGLIALSGWTGAITNFVAGLWIVIFVYFAVFAATAICSAVIAGHHRHRVAKRYNRWWFYLIWLLAFSAFSLVANKNRGVLFGYDLYRVPSVSMSPTIELDDFILVDTWQYGHHAPADGDVVVLHLKEQTGVKYVKRIVGIPGDQIELRDSALFRNGRPVSEPYVHSVEPFFGLGRSYGPIVVAPDQVFVLGDYRDNSADSRVWGVIPVSQIQGRVHFIWFSSARGHFQANRIGIDLRLKK